MKSEGQRVSATWKTQNTRPRQPQRPSRAPCRLISPLVQTEVIRNYAAAKGLEIVPSYEDEGRSGVDLKHRPAVKQPLKVM